MLRWLASWVCLLGLGCASSVDLCGESQVCGQDGLSYHDRCAALAAGTEVIHLGPCAAGCRDISCELACTLATGPDGCPRCACAQACTEPSDCAASEACEDGFCTPHTPDCRGDSQCNAAERCVEGRCVARDDGGMSVPDGGGRDGGMACPAGWILCGGDCVNPSDDLAHCGGCNNVCVGPREGEGAAVCRSGRCGLMCPDGYADCDGVTDNGCEKNTHEDRFHCGGCNVSCDGVCRAGACLARSCLDVEGWTLTSMAETGCTATCAGVSARSMGGAATCSIPGEDEDYTCTPPFGSVDCLSAIVMCCGAVISDIVPSP